MPYQIIKNKVIEDQDIDMFWTINFDIQKYYPKLPSSHYPQSSLIERVTTSSPSSPIFCYYTNSY